MMSTARKTQLRLAAKLAVGVMKVKDLWYSKLHDILRIQLGKHWVNTMRVRQQVKDNPQVQQSQAQNETEVGRLFIEACKAGMVAFVQCP